MAAEVKKQVFSEQNIGGIRVEVYELRLIKEKTMLIHFCHVFLLSMFFS